MFPNLGEIPSRGNYTVEGGMGSCHHQSANGDPKIVSAYFGEKGECLLFKEEQQGKGWEMRAYVISTEQAFLYSMLPLTFYFYQNGMIIFSSVFCSTSI